MSFPDHASPGEGVGAWCRWKCAGRGLRRQAAQGARKPWSKAPCAGLVADAVHVGALCRLHHRQSPAHRPACRRRARPPSPPRARAPTPMALASLRAATASGRGCTGALSTGAPAPRKPPGESSLSLHQWRPARGVAPRVAKRWVGAGVMWTGAEAAARDRPPASAPQSRRPASARLPAGERRRAVVGLRAAT